MFEIVRIERKAETTLARAGRFALGTLLLAIGTTLVVIFTIAIGWELTGGTFFGLCICIMVVTFGLLLTRDAIAQLTGLRVRLKPVD